MKLKEHTSSKCFFIESIIDTEYRIIDITLWNYICFTMAVSGMICCLMNETMVAIIAFLLVFTIMNIKMVNYYKLYKKYQKKQYKIETTGSKYSFSNPKTLIIKRK